MLSCGLDVLPQDMDKVDLQSASTDGQTSSISSPLSFAIFSVLERDTRLRTRNHCASILAAAGGRVRLPRQRSPCRRRWPAHNQVPGAQLPGRLGAEKATEDGGHQVHH